MMWFPVLPACRLATPHKEHAFHFIETSIQWAQAPFWKSGDPLTPSFPFHCPRIRVATCFTNPQQINPHQINPFLSSSPENTLCVYSYVPCTVSARTDPSIGSDSHTIRQAGASVTLEPELSDVLGSCPPSCPRRLGNVNSQGSLSPLPVADSNTNPNYELPSPRPVSPWRRQASGLISHTRWQPAPSPVLRGLLLCLRRYQTGLFPVSSLTQKVPRVASFKPTKQDSMQGDEPDQTAESLPSCGSHCAATTIPILDLDLHARPVLGPCL